jgi:ATP-dependent helicase/nuclease subunit B
VRVVVHVDPVVLERELLSRVDAVHPRSGLARTLVLVPTNRLAEHVQRRLAGRRSAWLGLEVLSFRGFGREVLERATGRTLQVASPLLLESMLAGLLRERPSNGWSTFVRRRPGAAGRLLETLRDLREAGVEPADLAACAENDRGRDLTHLYADYHGMLEARSAEGWSDEAGLARAARPHVARFGEELSAVFVHGAYELLGVYLDLLRELQGTTQVTALLPICPGTRVTTYGERFAREFLLEKGEELDVADPGDDPDRTHRLVALYDEQAAPPPAGDEALCLRHAQGAAAEAKFAVREALVAVREGCAPTEVAITARSLEPYAAALEEAFDDAGLPWTSSLGSPLRRHTIVREFLLLLRVLAEDFPRDDTVELLQSRHLDWTALGCSASPPAARADAWSREAGIIDGLEEWSTELENLTADAARGPRGTEQARRIEEALRAVERAVPREAASWSGHASGLSASFDRIFGRPDHPSADQLHEILDVMGDLECLGGDRREVSFDEARAWLEEAVDAGTMTLQREDGGGIRVLDAMQLRGLTFERIHLMGLNSGLFPRAPREDPILPDPLRRALRLRTSRPIGVESDGGEEEHQLLAGLIGAARKRIDVSWQRADESGRAKNASLALRELARLAYGRPDIERVRNDATHLPSHPAQWLDSLVRETGLLSPDEERLLAALHSRAADAAESLGTRFPELLPGLDMLRATQSFAPARGDYDGRIGPVLLDKPLSVSALGVLGSCPLQFLFSSVLRVRPLEERANAFELARNELGNRIHALLEELYGALRDQGAFEAPADDLVERGMAWLDERRGRVFGDLGSRLSQRVPVLWQIETGRWLAAVKRFVRADLERIAGRGMAPAQLEELRSVPLEFGEGVAAEVRGKFDRLLVGRDATIVGDYKTSTSLGWRAQPTSMLKAKALQVPLYAMMAGRDAGAELLGVHPDLDPDDPESRPEFHGFDDERVAGGFRHTMRVLLRLQREGVFPFHDDVGCSWCRYTSACRRNHPPTIDREAQRTDTEGYRTVLAKSKRNPDGR